MDMLSVMLGVMFGGWALAGNIAMGLEEVRLSNPEKSEGFLILLKGPYALGKELGKALKHE